MTTSPQTASPGLVTSRPGGGAPGRSMMANRKVALVSLALGTLLFALAPPVLKLLTTMGGRVGLQMPGAVSFCNVLFVGNLCAGLVTLVFSGPRGTVRELGALPRKRLGLLVLAAFVATVYPALLYTGLERTSVINVVLLSRFNGIVLVAFGYLFLRSKVRASEVAGYAVMGVGVLILVAVTNGGFAVRSGDLFVLLATVFFALTEIVSQKVLKTTSIHAYVFFRNLVSALIFFVLGIYLFGLEHFSDAFVGELWILMLVYAGIAVVLAQVLWLKATRVLPVQIVANFQLLNPAFSIASAYLLLKEIPTPVEWLVMAIVLVGVLLPRWLGGPRARMAVPAAIPETALSGK